MTQFNVENKFSVGDKVVVCQNPREDIDGIHWNIQMDKTCDMIGTIVLVFENGAYFVDFGGSDQWSYHKDWIRRVGEESKTEEHSRENVEWTDKHYDFSYQLTRQDVENGFVKVDPYFVAKQWKIGSKDDSGALWHCFKTIARFGEKNSKEREIRALHAQIKRFAELEGIEL